MMRGVTPDRVNHPEPVWDTTWGNRSLIAATVLVAVVALFVPQALVFGVVAWVIAFISWVFGRSVMYVRNKAEQQRCRCCREGYPVIWVEPRIRTGYWPSFDPEFHLCERHTSRWLRIMELEREVLPLEVLRFPY